MLKETTFVECFGDHAFLGAAAYLAIILYPDDKLKRNKFVYACEAWICKRWCGGQLKRRLIKKAEILDFSDTRKIEAQFNKAEKILMEKRWPAAHVFRLQFFNKLFDNVSLSNGENFTLNKWIELNYQSPANLSGDQYQQKNAYKTMWSPSKKIVHLILGLENSITDAQRPLSIESFLLHPEWVIEAINISESLRKAIVATNAINIKESEQIQILPQDIS